MKMNELPGAGRSAIARGARQSARLSLAMLLLLLGLGLGLGLASGSARAALKNAMAISCKHPNAQEIMPWTVVNPLTSSTAIGTVLMERRFSMTTSFSPISTTEAHELVTGAHWVMGFGPAIGADGVAPTDIDGIGFKWEALSPDGVNRPITKQTDPLAVKKMDVYYDTNGPSGPGGAVTSYKQFLILTRDPNTLGPGEIKVTSIGGGLQVRIHTVDFPTSAGVSLGSTFVVPNSGQGCRGFLTFDSTGIINIVDGPPPVIPKTCDVVANQIIPVDLGRVPLSQFKALGDTSPPKHFEIALSNCAVNAKPMISFRDKASPPNADKTVLRLSAPAGQSVAQGFGIIMTREDGTRERIAYGDPGAATEYEMTKHGSSAKLPLSAQYLRTGSDAELKAGYAGGSAEFTFTFP